MIGHENGSASGPAAVRDVEDAVVVRLQALAAHLDCDPDPAYRARTRARLVAMAAVRTPEPARGPLRDRLRAVRAVDRSPSRWRGRITAGLAGAAVGVTALAALVAVAAGAGPGDALYGLKRGTEQTQLALAGSSRGQTLLELAGTRLDEVARLAGGGDAALVTQTLRTMDEQTTEGAALLTAHAVRTGDARTLDALTEWTAAQSAGLDAVGPEVPAGAGPAHADSVDLLDELAVRATGLRAALQCPSGPVTVGEDALGPVPSACPAASPPVVPDGSPAPALPVPGTPPDAGTPSDAGPPPAAVSTAPAPPSPPEPVGVPPRPTRSSDPHGGAAPPPVPDGAPLPRTVPVEPLPEDPPTLGEPTVPALPAAPLSVCSPPLTVGQC